MRIYTKTGDAGRTRLLGGEVRDKSDPRIAAYGEVDELNSFLGLARRAVGDEFARILERIQGELFELGAELASPDDGHAGITDADVAVLEGEIDRLTERASELRHFILPGGAGGAAELHAARAMCRRAERAIVALSTNESIRAVLLRYANRLSDHLFTMARAAAAEAGDPETVWRARKEERG